MASIKLVSIEKHFGQLYVIRKLNLEVQDREFVVLLGPSGCGKTTTLRAIAGLEEIESGEILIEGKPVQDLQARDRDIAFVFQLFALYPHLTAFENIAFPLRAIRTSRATIEERVKEVAQVLQIEHLLNRRPRALSGGDMQRVAVGRAMVRRPKAFLMDEPIGSLDAKLREGMRTELKRLHRRIGATTLYVTHDQVEAMSMADRIAIMHDGILQQVGSPEEVYDDPANLFVAQFIGSPIMNVVDCTVDHNEHHTRVLLGRNDLAFLFPKELDGKIREKNVSEGHLVLGIRPEGVSVERTAKEDYVKAEVHVIEPIGSYDIVDIKVGDQVIRAKTPSRFVEKVGDPIWIRLDEQRSHFFDKRTGQSLDL
jgi:multiple sugar transport system ATP-binding protein